MPSNLTFLVSPTPSSLLPLPLLTLVLSLLSLPCNLNNHPLTFRATLHYIWQYMYYYNHIHTSASIPRPYYFQYYAYAYDQGAFSLRMRGQARHRTFCYYDHNTGTSKIGTSTIWSPTNSVQSRRLYSILCYMCMCANKQDDSVAIQAMIIHCCT